MNTIELLNNPVLKTLLDELNSAHIIDEAQLNRIYIYIEHLKDKEIEKKKLLLRLKNNKIV